MKTNITIYHYPACSKSRAVLEILRAAGIEPQIVDYAATGMTAQAWADLLRRSGLTAAQALRENCDAYREHVAGQDWDEADLLDLMACYPELVNRPFVVSEKGVLLCRPPERVYELI